MTKQQLAAEIISILGNSLDITIAHFTDKSELKKTWESEFIKYFKQNSLEMLREDGLSLIAANMPQLMPEVLERAENEKKFADIVQSALASKSKPRIVRCVPEEINRLFRIIAKADKPEYKEKMTKQMLDDLTDPRTLGLSSLCFLDEKDCAVALDKFSEIKYEEPLLGRALTAQRSHLLMTHRVETGESGLYHLCRAQPRNIPKLLRVAAQEKKGTTSILKALDMKISESKKTNLAVICAENKENAIALAAFIQGLPDETAQQNKEMRRLQILYRTCYVSSVLLWLIADRTYFSGMMTFVSVISGLCGFGFHGGSDEIKEHRDLYHAVKGELVSLSQSQQTLFGGSISMPAKQVVEANSRSFNLPCVIL